MAAPGRRKRASTRGSDPSVELQKAGREDVEPRPKLTLDPIDMLGKDIEEGWKTNLGKKTSLPCALKGAKTGGERLEALRRYGATMAAIFAGKIGIPKLDVKNFKIVPTVLEFELGKN